jgi:hypothetical protein
MLELKSFEKIAQDLIFALSVVLVSRLAEQRAEFRFADSKSCAKHQTQDVVVLETEGDLQLAEDDVVVQPSLGHGHRALALAAMLDDQAVQERCQLNVVERFERRIIVALEPGTRLLPRDRVVGLGKYGDHLSIIETERVSKTAQDIVVVHGSILVPLCRRVIFPHGSTLNLLPAG